MATNGTHVRFADQRSIETVTSAGGGVMLPKPHDVERASNAHQPYHPSNVTGAPTWKGPCPVNTSTAVNGDPFAKTSAPKLNPNTASFQPGPSKPSLISSLNRNSIEDKIAQPVIVTSTPDDAANAHDKGTLVAQQPIGTRADKYSPVGKRAHFTTDVGPKISFAGGHYIRIDDLNVADMARFREYLDNDMGWKCKVRGARAGPEDRSGFIQYYVQFDDIRDAATAASEIELANPEVSADYISQAEYASGQDSQGIVTPSSFYDGQIQFVADFMGRTRDFTTMLPTAADAVKQVARCYGEVFAFQESESATCPFVEFRVEYLKISAAKRALKERSKNTPMVIDNWSITARALYDPAEHAAAQHHANGLENGVAAMAMTTPQKIIDSNGTVFDTSPTGRSSWREDENGLKVIGPAARHVPKVVNHINLSPAIDRDRWNSAPDMQTPSHLLGGDRGPRFNSLQDHYFDPKPVGRGAVGNAQSVEAWKILNGQDVRTTIMIRNVPNNLDYAGFKSILDRCIYGKYDFSYLRIDFENQCNVGYAFVNVEDPQDIVTLLTAMAGKPWPSNPKRTFECSYATIQGLECLVEKFRNSAVMSECPNFRPKLWETFNTASDESTVGQERPFPTPNNATKLQRSHDNATTMGLYANRNHRMMQRNIRRSQYDRGTPAQLHEDFRYDQQLITSPYNNHYGQQFVQSPNGYMMSPPAVGYAPMPMHPSMMYHGMGVYHPGPMMFPGQFDVPPPFHGDGAYHGRFYDTPTRGRMMSQTRQPRIGHGGPVQSPVGDLQNWSFQQAYHNGYIPSMAGVAEESEPQDGATDDRRTAYLKSMRF